MTKQPKLEEIVNHNKPAEPNIEATCSKDHPLTNAAGRFLKEGLQSDGSGIGIDLNHYDKKSYGSEVEFSLAKTKDCLVIMSAILLRDGRIGNPQIIVNSPEYKEEIYNGSDDDIIAIKGKKISFFLGADGQFVRTVSFGSSTSYEPYSAVMPDCWGEPSVPEVSHEGFLVEREISDEEKELLTVYLENPSDITTLAFATKCTDEDRKIREQKRQEVLECVATKRQHEERFEELSKSHGTRPFPFDKKPL